MAKRNGKTYMIGGVPTVLFNDPSPHVLKIMREGVVSTRLCKADRQARAEGDALFYAKWLAKRDRNALPTGKDVRARVETEWVTGADESRPVRVVWERGSMQYVDETSYWRGRRGVSRSRERQWVVKKILKTIELPNWDFVPTVTSGGVEQVELKVAA